MDWWKNGWIDIDMDGWIDKNLDGLVNERVGEETDIEMDWLIYIDEWIDRLMKGGWIDELTWDRWEFV